MDPGIILQALQAAGTAALTGAVNESGKICLNLFINKLKAVVSPTEIDAIEKNPNSQKIARVFLEHLSGASQKEKEELAKLAHEVLDVVQQNNLAQRNSKAHIIVDRVFELFDRHSIDRLTMEEVLGVPFSALKEYDLVNHLDSKKVNELADTFAVSREWLSGGKNFFGECICKWYKYPSDAIAQLIRLTLDNKNPTIYFVKSKLMNDKEMVPQSDPQQYVAVVAEVFHKTPLGQPFKSYQRWESLPWDYQRSRTNLLTFAMFCQCISGFELDRPDLSDDAKEIEAKLKKLLRYKFRRNGIAVTPKVFTQYEEMTLLPCELISDSNWSVWDIDYYVDFPRISRAQNTILLKEYDYAQEEYQDSLKILANWKEFSEIIANA